MEDIKNRGLKKSADTTADLILSEDLDTSELSKAMRRESFAEPKNGDADAEDGKVPENERGFDDGETAEFSDIDDIEDGVSSAVGAESADLAEDDDDDAVIFVKEERFNVYDFDKTLLPYDSTAAFFIFCLKRRLGLIFAVLPAALIFPLYLIGFIKKTRMKEIFYQRFLGKVENIDDMIELFWRIKKNDFYPWYLARKKNSDLVISASPDFLLRPICNELGIRLIASRVDKHSGKTDGLNNFGMEKLRRFRAEFPLAVIEEFYSDSLSDEPLAMIAEKSFIVKHGRPSPWPKQL